MGEHTPTPWKVGEDQNDGRFIYQFDPATKRSRIIGAMQFVDDLVNGKYVLSDEVGKANAEFIVRAVNSYDEDQRKIAALLEAAKKAIKAYLRLPIGPDVEAIVMDEMEELEKAIAKAEGRP